MTVKEIAQAVGRDSTVVTRWIQKIVHMQNACVDPKNLGLHGKNFRVNDVPDDKMSPAGEKISSAGEKISLRNSIAEKAGNKDPHHPADYTPEEASLIVEAGLGRNAAGIFLANLGMAAELAQIKERYEKFFSLMERLEDKIAKISAKPAALPDLREEAYRELADFVEKWLILTGNHKHSVDLGYIYDKYRAFAGHILSEREFSHKICLDNPELELKKTKFSCEITGCLNKYG
jgi:hypothetical protein